MSLKNKVMLITGASSGIGAAIALEASKEGAETILIGRNETKITKVSENIKKTTGKKPLVILGDISKDDDVKRIVASTIKHHGKLDILVNNAGFGKVSNIMDADTMQVFDSIMNTNLRGAVHLTHLCAPHLVKTKGNIINISSIGALRPFAPFWSYCVSKAGMDHFTRCMASALAPQGVRVNSVNPGPVTTDFIENSGTNEKDLNKLFNVDSLKGHTALGRVSESVEVANIVMFLASDKAIGVTGSIYVADNGSMIK